MQKTHDIDDEGFEYPDDLQVTDVNVFVHPSGMIMTHDYSCPVCREKHAVIDANTGVMGPCWECRDKGYRMIKVEKSWWNNLLFNWLTGKELR